MLAAHATAINWQSIGAIAAVLAIFLGLMTWYLTRRDTRQAAQNEAIKQEIADAVGHLGERLEAKLETKETVSRISERLARLEGAAGMPNRDNSTIH